MTYYCSETRIASRVLIRRERLLPARGEVLVAIDDLVDAVDVVARATDHGRLRFLDASTALGVKPQSVTRYVTKRAGESARAGEPLAVRPRLGKLLQRSLRAPADGKIVATLGGLFLFEEEASPLEVRADISGRVVSEMPSRGVVIETVGALIQAAFGTGPRSSGVLRLVAQSPEALTDAQHIDVASLGSILVGGAGVTEAALREAERLRAKGLIIGGLSTTLLSLARSLPFPVLATEGFGAIPMNRMVFELLAGSQGREAALDPGDMSPWSRVRPEIIVPEQVTVPAAPEPAQSDILDVGSLVRVVRAPHTGLIGTVTALPPAPIPYQNGLCLPSAHLRTADAGVELTVPVANLELVKSGGGAESDV